MSPYGTNIGPHCVHCESSVWAYHPTHYSDLDARVKAVCSGCGASEHYQTSTAPQDATDYRQAHEHARHATHGCYLT